MEKRILVVEDDNDIRQIEKDYLKKAGYTVFEAPNGEKAIQIFMNETIDVVILDVGLPGGISGIDVLRGIREVSPVPIVMVTARTKEADEILGLEVGADDYIGKPFSPKILVLRVDSLLKRIQTNSVESKDIEILRFSGLEIIPDELAVIRDGVNYSLTAIQMNILLILASTPGKIFSRDALMERGYEGSLPPDIFDRTIDAHIKNIRKILEKNPKDPQFIHTVRGRGYKFYAQ